MRYGEDFIHLRVMNILSYLTIISVADTSTCAPHSYDPESTSARSQDFVREVDQLWLLSRLKIVREFQNTVINVRLGKCV